MAISHTIVRSWCQDESTASFNIQDRWKLGRSLREVRARLAGYRTRFAQVGYQERTFFSPWRAIGRGGSPTRRLQLLSGALDESVPHLVPLIVPLIVPRLVPPLLPPLVPPPVPPLAQRSRRRRNRRDVGKVAVPAADGRSGLRRGGQGKKEWLKTKVSAFKWCVLRCIHLPFSDDLRL